MLAVAAAATAAAMAAAPLRFDDSGDFKIVQFTDNHYKTGAKASAAAVQCIESVLDAEQPQLVVFTGDMVYSEGVAEGLDSLLRPVVDRGIPFAFTFGNHDTQFELNHDQIYDYLCDKPGAMMPRRTEGAGHDYVLEVASTDGSRIASALYCLDSHRGTQVRGIGKYAWIEFPQIMWYRSRSDAYTAGNGGTPLPSLMFFHIPIPEADYAYSSTDNFFTGVKKENVCCPALNSGLFTSLREKGDVKGVFFGHDHDNDYAVAFHDILLAYGRYSGGKTVYNHLGEPGARVILLHQDSPEFDTWIRLAKSGSVADRASFPSSFKATRKRK